jgi:hypothetical protein
MRTAKPQPHLMHSSVSRSVTEADQSSTLITITLWANSHLLSPWSANLFLPMEPLEEGDLILLLHTVISIRTYTREIWRGSFKTSPKGQLARKFNPNKFLVMSTRRVAQPPQLTVRIINKYTRLTY